MRDLRPADRIDYIMTGDLEDIDAYIVDFIPYVRNMCTAGGTYVHNRKCTYYDPQHPVWLVNAIVQKEEGEELGKTSYLIAKQNIYIVALTVGGKWKELDESGFCFFHSNGKRFESAHFNVNYQKCGGLKNSDVGLKCFAEAVVDLQYDVRVLYSLHVSCIHISESARFRKFFDLICCAQEYDEEKGKYVVGKTPLPYEIREIALNWQKLGDLYRSSYPKEFSELSIFHQNLLTNLGLTSMEEVDNLLCVVLVENFHIREERRKKALGGKSVCEGAVNLKNIKISSRNVSDELRTWNALIVERAEFWRCAENGLLGGQPDIWRSLKDVVKACHSDMRLARLIIEHTDVFLMNTNLTRFIDYQGFNYNLEHYIVSDPSNMKQIIN